MILGQDWLASEHVFMDFSVGQACLGRVQQHRITMASKADWEVSAFISACDAIYGRGPLPVIDSDDLPLPCAEFESRPHQYKALFGSPVQSNPVQSMPKRQVNLNTQSQQCSDNIPGVTCSVHPVQSSAVLPVHPVLCSTAPPLSPSRSLPSITTNLPVCSLATPPPPSPLHHPTFFSPPPPPSGRAPYWHSTPVQSRVQAPGPSGATSHDDLSGEPDLGSTVRHNFISLGKRSYSNMRAPLVPGQPVRWSNSTAGTLDSSHLVPFYSPPHINTPKTAYQPHIQGCISAAMATQLIKAGNEPFLVMITTKPPDVIPPTPLQLFDRIPHLDKIPVDSKNQVLALIKNLNREILATA